MNQSYFGRQQILDAMAADSVGVAAAEFHQCIPPLRLDLPLDAGGQTLRQSAIAKFIQVFHGQPPPRIRRSAGVSAASSGSRRLRA